MTSSTRTAALVAPKRRVVRGLPVYAVEGDTAYCALFFRVGKSDEALPIRGISHMVEHLALFDQSERTYHLNGFVDTHRTAFHADGTEDECLEFISGVTAALVDLPMHRLEQERRVLAAEEGGSGHGLWGELVLNRFGARGFGVVGYEQLGLESFDARAVQGWADDRFTAGNAVLVVSGIDPRRIEHALPMGDRWPAVESEPIEDDLPAYFTARSRGVGLSMVARRSPALTQGLRLLEKRLYHRLRTELAVVYSVSIDVTDEGPRPAEMEADRTVVERRWSGADVSLRLAHVLSNDELWGAERRTPAGVRKAELATTAGDVASSLAVARRTALWALPRHAVAPDGLRRVSAVSPFRMDGRRIPRVGPPTPSDPPAEELVLADAGVGLQAAQGWHVHVEYARCAGALAWRDGTRVLIGDDGFTVAVRPWEWRDGSVAVAEIDARLDADLVVPMGDGTGPPPPAPAPAPATAAAHARRASVRRVVLPLAFAMFALAALVLPFSGPSLAPGDVQGVARRAVPVDASGDVRCGGSVLSIWRHGANVPDAGPATPIVAAACENESRTLLVACGVSLVVATGLGGWYVHDRRRRAQVSVRP